MIWIRDSPVMPGRDHHDTGGTDSFRETSNIKDGSNILADMATSASPETPQGMSMVAPHNGGGVGIAKL